MNNQVANIYENNNMQVQNKELSATKEMVTTRQAQEVQAAMIMAKRFPRDEVEAFNRILKSCQRRSLAEQSMYEYPRGGQKVTGPSIRLAEALAQNWGNLNYGIIELEQKDGESQVMAYAWDLETNTRHDKVFSVPHIRTTKHGNKTLTDPRDIYEMVANQGTRRLRACILGVIPGDVIDSAVEQCQLTLKGANPEPLIDRVRKMVKTFEDKFSVTKEMLEEYIGCNSDAFSENDFIILRNIYASLKDGMSKREDWFKIKSAEKSVFELDNNEKTKEDGDIKGQTNMFGGDEVVTDK
ncbi:hypothetical protein KQI18_13940 [Clostridioides mangenotii]|uniref:hypothetical protein n=1 Tax=Metaclostridioides mangenotii TaxID=1540 RepID=UPI001C11F169|nr:hypothetical protein [Clostridioides mangenotii]MBU5308834.1 hypothetical protein [Clostridioides mangenotii]